MGEKLRRFLSTMKTEKLGLNISNFRGSIDVAVFDWAPRGLVIYRVSA